MSDPKRTKKKPVYSAPKLTVYGEVTKLTASGTGNGPENSQQNTPNRHP